MERSQGLQPLAAPTCQPWDGAVSKWIIQPLGELHSLVLEGAEKTLLGLALNAFVSKRKKMTIVDFNH